MCLSHGNQLCLICTNVIASWFCESWWVAHLLLFDSADRIYSDKSDVSAEYTVRIESEAACLLASLQATVHALDGHKNCINVFIGHYRIS